MLSVKIICVGKLKEKFYTDAVREYSKRLSPFCRLEIDELSEEKRQGRSSADTAAALEKEAQAIISRIPKGSYIIAMCIEGRKMDSGGFSEYLSSLSVSGQSKLCFLIGGSDGLHDSVKGLASLRLSMSDMTFPHHLARVMLLEQLYRAFKIEEGGKYHK